MDEYIELKTEEDFKKYWNTECYFMNIQHCDERTIFVKRLLIGYNNRLATYNKWVDSESGTWSNCYVKNLDYNPHRHEIGWWHKFYDFDERYRLNRLGSVSKDHRNGLLYEVDDEFETKWYNAKPVSEELNEMLNKEFPKENT